MPLKLIHGPPNSGRADRIQALFREALDRDPVLVLPTLDDVFRFERILLPVGAALGGSVMTFGELFREVARCTGAPSGGELTPAQRLAAVSTGIAARRGRAGAAATLRRPAGLRDPLRAPARRAAERRPRAGLAGIGSADAGVLGLPRRPDRAVRRLRRGEGPARPARRARRRARRDRGAAGGAAGLAGAAGLPLRAGRPDPEPARPDRGAERRDRGHRRPPL